MISHNIEISYQVISQYKELYQDLIDYVNSWIRFYNKDKLTNSLSLEDDLTFQREATKIDRIYFKIRLDKGNTLCARIYTSSGSVTNMEYESHDGYGIPISFYNRLISVYRDMQLDKVLDK